MGGRAGTRTRHSVQSEIQVSQHHRGCDKRLPLPHPLLFKEILKKHLRYQERKFWMSPEGSDSHYFYFPSSCIKLQLPLMEKCDFTSAFSSLKLHQTVCCTLVLPHCWVLFFFFPCNTAYSIPIWAPKILLLERKFFRRKTSNSNVHVACAYSWQWSRDVQD